MGETTVGPSDPYCVIYDRIIEGWYRPGERIVEQRIATELGISRTPVREALRRLQATGLVVYEQNRGVAVRTLSREDVKDLYELRASLESLAAERAATRADVEDIRTMDEAIEAFNTALSEVPSLGLEAVRRLNVANRLFHDSVVSASHHQMLSRFLSITVDAPLVFHSFRRFNHSQSERSNIFHQLIRDAIANGEPSRAGRLMTEHIEQGLAVLLAGFDSADSVEVPRASRRKRT